MQSVLRANLAVYGSGPDKFDDHEEIVSILRRHGHKACWCCLKVNGIDLVDLGAKFECCVMANQRCNPTGILCGARASARVLCKHVCAWLCVWQHRLEMGYDDSSG